MSPEIVVELIRLVPSLLWILLIAVLLAVFYKPIRQDLLPRLSGFKAFGLEVALLREQLDQAITKQGAQVGERERAQVLRRAGRLTPTMQGAQILWVDDNPDNNEYERRILHSLGTSVDMARTSADALSLLSQKRYELVISDMERNGVADEGQRFLEDMRNRGYSLRLIYYIGRLDPEKGVPAYAFGITNRPDTLLHLVLDALERDRG
jgi:CheY-like chemotaxis protein